MPRRWHASSRSAAAMKPIRLVLVVLVLALLSGGRAAAQANARPNRPEVEAVRLEGVRALEERLVRSVLVTRESRCRSPLLFLPCALGEGEREAFLDTAQVRRDEARVDSLYEAWGYPGTTVESDVAPQSDGDVVVTFRVAEGAPILVRTVSVRGLEAVPGGEVDVSALPLRPGEPYAAARLETSQRQILAALAERGYAFARVDVGGSVSPDGTAADVVLEVVPGPSAVFGPTEIRAQSPIGEEEVRRRLAFHEGDPFRPEALRRSVERLYDIPVVEDVRVQPAPGPPGDTAVRTTVTVTRGKLAAAQGDIVVSSTTCLGGTATWAHRYLLGAPRVLTLTAGTANLGTGTVCDRNESDEFEDPSWFVRGALREPLAPETWLLLDAEFVREAVTRAYVRRGARGRAALAGPLTRALRGEAGYALERSENEAAGPFFCALYGACADADLAGRTGLVTLAPVELALTWQPPEARRLRLTPVPAESASVAGEQPRWTYGARAILSAAAGATGSEVGYARAGLDATVARWIDPRAELAARARVAALASDDDVPPQVRLYGGGPRGVRGVAPNLLGPRFLLLREGEEDEIGCPFVTGGCEGADIDPDRVLVRALGGEALAEASVEARLWISRGLQLAAFVDAGAVWSGAGDGGVAGIAESESVVTPGVGALLVLPAFGPVRVDVAYNPSPARRVPLVARDPNSDDVIFLGDVRFDPFGRGGATGWEAFRRRLQLQLSLGQQF